MYFSLGMLIVTLCINTTSGFKNQQKCQKELTECYNQMHKKYPKIDADPILEHCLMQIKHTSIADVFNGK